ncbi:MAG TPA: ribose 5-phosphate isomerase B [archaeon]|nr:ribose 5-phosphate isomerase B [archaeon]
MSKIAIGSDHRGFELKEYLKKELKGYEFDDLGTNSNNSVDYPDIAKDVAMVVANNKYEKGILICYTGIGMSIAANKVKGIRAALCHDETTAKMSREHNDANVLCLGSGMLEEEQAKAIAEVWLKTPFSNEERHIDRNKKIKAME